MRNLCEICEIYEVRFQFYAKYAKYTEIKGMRGTGLLLTILYRDAKPACGTAAVKWTTNGHPPSTFFSGVTTTCHLLTRCQTQRRLDSTRTATDVKAYSQCSTCRNVVPLKPWRPILKSKHMNCYTLSPGNGCKVSTV